VNQASLTSGRKLLASLAFGTALATGCVSPSFAQTATTTPIQHVIVIFQENASFDHYFGTYPIAANPPGEPAFFALNDTPTINGITAVGPTGGPGSAQGAGALLATNTNPVLPFRLDRNNALTCDQNHAYTAEQQAVDAGTLDHFALASGSGGTSGTGLGCQDASGNNIPGYAMGYFDGNTVTALWNYAQNFAINDNSFGTTYGPSTPGAINLISGQTHGIVAGAPFTNAQMVAAGIAVPDGTGVGYTLISDNNSNLDDCGSPTSGISFTDPNFPNKNVGDLLNAQHVTWGWFGGGFKPTTPAAGSTPAVCAAASTGHPGVTTPPPGATAAQIHTQINDYNAHHSPFQYYTSTVNPHHLPYSSVAAIGTTDQANHQYDLNDFFTALNAGNIPAVSYLKAKDINDGHPGNSESDALSEQAFLVNTINAVMQHEQIWETTAIIVAWDDSDGYYDHVTGPLVNASASAADAFQGTGKCGTPAAGAFQGRCGYGPRLPLLVISPYAKQNFVDHNLTDQTSILRFIEENWSLGFIDGPKAPPVGTGSFDRYAGQINGMFDFTKTTPAPAIFLDPTTGQNTGL
jgi:phospholipase C